MSEYIPGAYEKSTKMCFWTFLIGVAATVLAFLYLHWIAGFLVGGITWLFCSAAGRSCAVMRSRLPSTHPDHIEQIGKTMKTEYEPYDTNKAIVVTASNNQSMLAYPRNMNPFKIMKIECFRNEADKVVMSLMDDNSTLYTRHEWETLLKTPPLLSEYENKLVEVFKQAEDAREHFLKNER